MCGIFGIISTEPKPFDRRAFSVLGVNNDTRGGDSCGIFIDGAVEYGLSSTKTELYALFSLNSDLLKSTKEAEIAIGHCRKASVGGKDERLVQPYCIRDKDGNIEFVLIHNGTIKNHDDLAKKYLSDIDTRGMNDSQIMGEIFYRKGYDVLLEYVGGAVFVAIDYRSGKPEMRFFKGKSKEYYTSTIEEERPLFYVLRNDGTLIFSSISAFLFPLFPEDTVYIAPSNKLMLYDNGTLKVEKEYDRSNIVNYNYTANSYYNGYLKGEPVDNTRVKGSESLIIRGNCNFNDDYDDPEYGYQDNRRKSYEYPSDNDFVRYQLCDRDFRFHKYVNGHECVHEASFPHGRIYCSKYGYLVNEKDAKLAGNNPYYFWHGILLYNKHCFNFLSAVRKTLGSDLEMDDVYPYLPFYLSPYPLKDILLTESYWAVKVAEPFGETLTRVDGTMPRLFSDKLLIFRDGYLTYQGGESDFDDNIKKIKDLGSFKITKELASSFLDIKKK